MMELIIAFVLAVCGACLIFDYGKEMRHLTYVNQNSKIAWRVIIACWVLMLSGMCIARFCGWC